MHHRIIKANIKFMAQYKGPAATFRSTRDALWRAATFTIPDAIKNGENLRQAHPGRRIAADD